MLCRPSAAKQFPKGLPAWFERGASCAVLLALSPIMLLCALAVRLGSPGPILFRQERVGEGGRPFQLVKFRSMRTNNEGAHVTASGDKRVTRVGEFLRKTKLDELPELWNVVRGDLSLVGPRPEVPKYVDFESPQWREVLSVRPGITDPVTIRLRHEEEILAGVEGDLETYYRETLLPEKLRGYTEYLRRRSLWSDLGVLISTVWAIARSAPPQYEVKHHDGT